MWGGGGTGWPSSVLGSSPRARLSGQRRLGGRGWPEVQGRPCWRPCPHRTAVGHRHSGLGFSSESPACPVGPTRRKTEWELGDDAAGWGGNPPFLLQNIPSCVSHPGPCARPCVGHWTYTHFGQLPPLPTPATAMALRSRPHGLRRTLKFDGLSNMSRAIQSVSGEAGLMASEPGQPCGSRPQISQSHLWAAGGGSRLSILCPSTIPTPAISPQPRETAAPPSSLSALCPSASKASCSAPQEAPGSDGRRGAHPA